MTGTLQTGASSSPGPATAIKWIVVCLIGLCALLAHYKSIDYPFLVFDDSLFVTQNPVVLKGFTLEGVQYAFTDIGDDYNWVPVTRLSHMLDVQIHGESAWGHHLTNILLHTANAMLLWLLLNLLTRSVWRSALASVLFAVHPVHVESIAWIAERRDVLSMFFGLLGMIAYTRYSRADSRRQKIIAYGLVVLGCTLSMMAKPTMVTLPCVLWLLDFWPLVKLQHAWRSQQWRSALAVLVLEKLPLFGAAGLSAYFTLAAQSSGILRTDEVPLSQRIIRVPLAYADYLGMLAWPVNLSPMYVNRYGWTIFAAVTSLVILFAITYLAVRFVKRQPFLLVGWLWYLGTLVPMIGLVVVGKQTHACRYAYLPFLGLYIMLAWLAGIAYARLIVKLPQQWVRNCSAAVACVLVIMLIAGSQIQSNIWSSDMALYESMSLTMGPYNPVVVVKVNAMMRENKIAEATKLVNMTAVLQLAGMASMIDSLMSIRIQENNFDHAQSLGNMSMKYGLETGRTMYLMGDIAMAQNHPQQAAAYYARSLELTPGTAEVYLSQFLALQAINDQAAADVAIHKSLNILTQRLKDSGFASDSNNWYFLGVCYSRLGQPQRAEAAFRHAMDLGLSASALYNSLGIVLAQMGRMEEAADAFRQAIDAAPSNKSAKDNLQRALQKLKPATDAKPVGSSSPQGAQAHETPVK